jgi:hypothetical protein
MVKLPLNIPLVTPRFHEQNICPHQWAERLPTHGADNLFERLLDLVFLDSAERLRFQDDCPASGSFLKACHVMEVRQGLASWYRSIAAHWYWLRHKVLVMILAKRQPSPTVRTRSATEWQGLRVTTSRSANRVQIRRFSGSVVACDSIPRGMQTLETHR